MTFFVCAWPSSLEFTQGFHLTLILMSTLEPCVRIQKILAKYL